MRLLLFAITATLLASALYIYFTTPFVLQGAPSAKVVPAQTITAHSDHNILNQHLEEYAKIPREMSETEANSILSVKVRGHDEDALALLVKIIHNKSDSSRLRNYAVQHLALLIEEQGSFSGLNYLYDASRENEDECIRDVAIFSLARVAHTGTSLSVPARQRAESAISEALTDSSSDTILIAAIRSSAFVCSSTITGRLELIAGDCKRSAPVRTAAIDVLGRMGDIKVKPIARAAIERHNYPSEHPLIESCNRVAAMNIGSDVTESNGVTINRAGE